MRAVRGGEEVVLGSFGPSESRLHEATGAGEFVSARRHQTRGRGRAERVSDPFYAQARPICPLPLSVECHSEARRRCRVGRVGGGEIRRFEIMQILAFFPYMRAPARGEVAAATFGSSDRPSMMGPIQFRAKS